MTPAPQSEIRQRREAELLDELAQLRGGQGVASAPTPAPFVPFTSPLPPTTLDTKELQSNIRAALTVLGTLGLVKPGLLQALFDPQVVQLVGGALILGVRV